jgi:hypothetical protein
MQKLVTSTPWTPHAGQIKGMRFALEHPMCILAAEPGTGKTTIALGAFKVLVNKGFARKMLIIAPLKVALLVWPKEVEKWADFQHYKVVVLHGRDRDESLIADADICVINPEGLDWLTGARRVVNEISGKTHIKIDVARVHAFGFDTLVIDELTKFKHVNTGRFKALRECMGLFARRWGLTGSLVANGLLDLFGQCYVIDGGRALGHYITRYRNKYFDPGPGGFDWRLKEGAEPLIYERIAPITLRLAAADYIDMPKCVHVTHKFDLPPEARRIYDAVQRDFFAEIERGTVTAVNAASKSGKCRQISAGAVYADGTGFDDPDSLDTTGPRPWREIHAERLDLLESIVGELQGAPLLVGYVYRHDAERLARRFPQARVLDAKNPKNLKAAEIDWNAGRIPILLGQMAATAHGINLQDAGNHVALFIPEYNFEIVDQFVRRVWRQGNASRRVFVHHLVATNTIDSLVLRMVRGKEKTQNKLYDALRDYAKNTLDGGEGVPHNVPNETPKGTTPCQTPSKPPAASSPTPARFAASPPPATPASLSGARKAASIIPTRLRWGSQRPGKR